MRSLGDASWVNDYIGMPYLSGGRDRDGIDCYGIIKMVYEDQFGIVLPDWSTDEFEQLSNRSKTIEQVIHSGTWTDKETPEQGDFAICYRTRAAHHVGVVLYGGVLHCHVKTGSIFEPLPRFVSKFGRVAFGEWQP